MTRLSRITHVARGALLAAAVACLVLAPALEAQDVADVRFGSGAVEFVPAVEYGAIVLTVSGPEGFYHRAEFGAGESPVFSLFDAAGDHRPDGVYSYELTVGPAETVTRDPHDGNQGLAKSAGAQGSSRIQSGTFAIRGGGFLDGDLDEPRGETGAGPEGNRLATKQVISGDLTVFNSLCVGFDCATSESYGADTIRLKENNLRIHFEDTSTAASFPTRDWRIVANDQANGGLDRFSIQDASASRLVTTIEGNAPSHSLYVDSGGRVGFGTNNPVVDLHVKDGDTPTLRLEQDTSSGFGAQTWDIAGNETSFFLRDATNGSTLPFRVFPGNPSGMLVVRDDSVGVGTTSPSERLHVRGTDGGTQVLIEEASGTSGTRTLALFKNNGNSTISFDHTGVGGGVEWNFGLGNTDQDFVISEQGSGQIELEIDSGSGNVTIAGQLVTGGPQCGAATPCDRVFSPEYEVESIEEHAAQMWANSYLPAVGPTEPNAPMNVSEKTGRILNELEKAHIYIEQLNNELKDKDEAISELRERLAQLEEMVVTPGD